LDSDLGTTIENIGTADSDQTDPVTDPEGIDVPESVLEIVKTNTGFTDNDGSGDISEGDFVLYDLTATNVAVALGGANLTNVVITDDLTGDTSTPLTLAPGESDTLSVSYTVQASDLGTTIANTGVADSDQTDPVTDPEDVDVPESILEIVKTNTGFTDNDMSGDISIGDDVLYDLTATNTPVAFGGANLTNVVISDDLTGDTSAPVTLAPGESDTLSVSYTVQASDLGTTIENTGTADSDQTNPVTDPEFVPVPDSDLVITKTNTGFTDNDGSGDISVGDDILYDLTATNIGGANLTNVVISDDLTGDTSTPATLAPGESDTLSVSYTVQESDLGTTIDNIGTADSDQTDPVEDPEAVDVPESVLEIIKINTGFTDNDGSGDVSVGDDVLYDLTATNIAVALGGANLTNVVITDDLTGDTSTPVTLAPGESDTLSVSYTVQESDLGITIANTGVADSDQTEPVTDPEGVDVPESVLEIIKTNTGFTDNDGSGDVSVGDDVLYDLTATNIPVAFGGANLTNVVISDDLTGDTSTPVTLAPGESDTLSVSYTVQDSDLGTTIANTGIADSDQT
ncbi:hypothetical protein Xen7305DRAFT_00054180, partial [Xenococcus sp. PCC 7305]